MNQVCVNYSKLRIAVAIYTIIALSVGYSLNRMRNAVENSFLKFRKETYEKNKIEGGKLKNGCI